MLNSGWIMRKGYDWVSSFLNEVARSKQVFPGSDYSTVLANDLGYEKLE
jgi:hypothetical protein